MTKRDLSFAKIAADDGDKEAKHLLAEVQRGTTGAKERLSKFVRDRFSAEAMGKLRKREAELRRQVAEKKVKLQAARAKAFALQEQVKHRGVSRRPAAKRVTGTKRTLTASRLLAMDDAETKRLVRRCCTGSETAKATRAEVIEAYSSLPAGEQRLNLYSKFKTIIRP